ncbi:IS30 family transposase [Mycobacterium sp. M1]|uniref:IS30 family transposase n=1 Tax=Mycolicibacter acidiphilus TaxID=2835306 RepID=A0ABS5RNS0_9MYCO|nr:IS30 family transposase [Mycolicibacter acidiphilus]MBS9535942.1 IS30 family transposase [Mycolicibacter acidiphilus]
MLTFEDRSDIAVGIQAGLSDTEIAGKIGRDRSVVWRERRRNSTKTRGYRLVHADCEAQRRRRCPQAFKIDTDPVLQARIRADLGRSRTPRQIAGRLRLEATDATVETMAHSPAADGATVSHEAIYRWIYALPKGELAKSGIMLRSKRTQRKRRKPLGERTGGRIIGMVSIDDRPDHVADRRVPGAWEGDLIIGRAGKSAAATLVERTSRFTLILGLPDGKNSDALADVLIDCVRNLPAQVRGSLTWDQGTEMARHAALTLATDLPVYFAHPHSPWERPTNENTNGLIREYLPKGTDITDHQPYLDAIADELNDRPRAILGFRTPREVFTQLLANSVASTT